MALAPLVQNRRRSRRMGVACGSPLIVMVGNNKSKFMPSVKEIKERSYFKFRGKGGEHDVSPRLEYERMCCGAPLYS